MLMLEEGTAYGVEPGENGQVVLIDIATKEKKTFSGVVDAVKFMQAQKRRRLH